MALFQLAKHRFGIQLGAHGISIAADGCLVLDVALVDRLRRGEMPDFSEVVPPPAINLEKMISQVVDGVAMRLGLPQSPPMRSPTATESPAIRAPVNSERYPLGKLLLGR